MYVGGGRGLEDGGEEGEEGGRKRVERAASHAARWVREQKMEWSVNVVSGGKNNQSVVLGAI